MSSPLQLRMPAEAPSVPRSTGISRKDIPWTACNQAPLVLNENIHHQQCEAFCEV